MRWTQGVEMKAVSASEFRHAIGSAAEPVLLCVTRSGSRPSSQLLAAVEGLAPALAARVQRLQVDIDAETALMDELRVHKEPELLLFAAGRVLERSEGEMTTEQVTALLEWAFARL